jgi:photosystem II stability/assembly factor-like uncharacterized protein
MEALVATALGCVRVDLEDGDAQLVEEDPPQPGNAEVSLPLVLAATQAGSRIVAVVDRRPPLMISDDVGLTWREAGGGLPRGVAIAVDVDDPDNLVFASESRLFVSEDGGFFWRSLGLELIGITAVAFS